MIPTSLTDKFYSSGSLENLGDGIRFSLKNRLTDVTMTRFQELQIDERVVPLKELHLEIDGRVVSAAEISPANPLSFPLKEIVRVRTVSERLPKGPHRIAVAFEVSPFGPLAFSVHDAIEERSDSRTPIPCDKADNATERMVRERQNFVAAWSGVRFEHIDRYSFDPRVTRGNVENFTGVAQIPIGVAGPLVVNGEHAKGEFLIPLATTEGTLVASYNRGMKVLNLAGGVTCTVAADCMQRAPVFVFASAREARSFGDWVRVNLEGIRSAAEASSSVARLLDIETYLVSRCAYLRFNFSTGDAAGQNMVGKAVLAACSFILHRVSTVTRFYLESNLATDKKASHMNVMRSRGKRVTAEAIVPRQILERHLRATPETLHDHASLATLGAFMAGANNNGAHSANGITGMFIATGQDVANVAESSAALLHTEVTPERDLYISITIPSLIVATHGGGTGLPTQRECLDILGCSGPGKARKLAEIVAAVALAGEISLGAAISSFDWVSSHETYGRNRIP